MSDDLETRLQFWLPQNKNLEEVDLPIWVLALLSEAAARIAELKFKLAEKMEDDAYIAELEGDYDKRGERIEELQLQLQSVLDRETSILRYYDAKLDAADAKQLQQALAMPAIAVLVDALCKSAEGWDNVMGMGLIAKKHFGAATVLRDEAIDALRRIGVKP